jgi:hypothetical protein
LEAAVCSDHLPTFVDAGVMKKNAEILVMYGCEVITKPAAALAENGD